MPVTIVVGGQFGSEGKGKVAKFLAETMGASVAVRCGGPNSGHTVIDSNGNPIVFKHLPTACILPDVICALCAGSYINIDILMDEIKVSNLDHKRLYIDPNAVIITPELIKSEHDSGLKTTIGSTGSGTGAAVVQRIQRTDQTLLAKDAPELKKYIRDVKIFLRKELDQSKRIIVEGTQGYGLSLLHTPYYPKATSRDTSAAGFLAEVGLSPLDVDDVVLTIRSFPIRVSGDSGPLPNEISWDIVTKESGACEPISETTSVTKKIRRVAQFHADVVCNAIVTNRPTRIILNHLDQVDASISENYISQKSKSFIQMVENEIGCRIDYVGLGRNILLKNEV